MSVPPIENSEQNSKDVDTECLQKLLNKSSENFMSLIEKKLEDTFKSYSETMLNKQSENIKQMLDVKFAQIIQKSDKLMQKRMDNSLFEVLPRINNISDGFATLRDQVSFEMKDVMSKLRDISETTSEYRISDPNDISEKMSVHRTSEGSCAKNSDQFGSEQFVSEGSLADCSKQSGPSEHGISENCPADGSKLLGSSWGFSAQNKDAGRTNRPRAAIHPGGRRVYQRLQSCGQWQVIPAQCVVHQEHNCLRR